MYLVLMCTRLVKLEVDSLIRLRIVAGFDFCIHASVKLNLPALPI